MNKSPFQKRAFTLVELLVALMVTAIVLGAVTAITFAVNSAQSAAESADRNEAQFRFAIIKINDLLRYSKLITDLESNCCYIWQIDKDNDGRIDADETILIEYNSNDKCLQLVEFASPPPLVNIPLDLLSFLNGVTGPMLRTNCNPRYTILVRNCDNVTFNDNQSPPYTTVLSISYDSAQDGIVRTYQITASLRCWAGYQFDETGGLNNSDDDGRI